MNKAMLMKRVNLGNYSHYELWLEVEDEDENRALERCVTMFNRGLVALGQEQISLEKVN